MVYEYNRWGWSLYLRHMNLPIKWHRWCLLLSQECTVRASLFIYTELTSDTGEQITWKYDWQWNNSASEVNRIDSIYLSELLCADMLFCFWYQFAIRESCSMVQMIGSSYWHWFLDCHRLYMIVKYICACACVFCVCSSNYTTWWHDTINAKSESIWSATAANTTAVNSVWTPNTNTFTAHAICSPTSWTWCRSDAFSSWHTTTDSSLPSNDTASCDGTSGPSTTFTTGCSQPQFSSQYMYDLWCCVQLSSLLTVIGI